MNFQSLIDNSPKRESNTSNSFGSLYPDSPPPSPKSPSKLDDLDEFEENLNYRNSKPGSSKEISHWFQSPKTKENPKKSVYPTKFSKANLYPNWSSKENPNKSVSPLKFSKTELYPNWSSKENTNKSVSPPKFSRTELYPNWSSRENSKKSVSPTKFSKTELYPNWSKNVNDKNSNPSKKRKTVFFKRKGYAAHCYLCNNSVKSVNLQQHLYFGFVKCEDCDKVITSCFKYSNLQLLNRKEGGNCTHTMLNWVFPPVDNLKLLCNEDEKTFDAILIKYIKSLNALKGIPHYKKALTCCDTYLNEKKYSSIKEKNLDDFSPTDEILPVTTSTTTGVSLTHSSKKRAKTKSHSVKRKNDDEENLLLPENGFYLIVRNAIEECPNCYEYFNPKFLKFNTNNWLITIKCKGCNLLVCFILGPPDGRDPKLTIINGL